MAVRGTVDAGAGGSLVTSVTGTANQITATPTTGAVVVSLPAAITLPANLAITGGQTLVPFSIGTVSSGTTTIACANGPQQYLVNGGAFTLAAPAADGNCILYVLNNASAGTITFSGFTVGASPGDALTTTNTSKFFISIIRINSISTYIVKALQ